MTNHVQKLVFSVDIDLKNGRKKGAKLSAGNHLYINLLFHLPVQRLSLQATCCRHPFLLTQNSSGLMFSLGDPLKCSMRANFSIAASRNIVIFIFKDRTAPQGFFQTADRTTARIKFIIETADRKNIRIFIYEIAFGRCMPYSNILFLILMLFSAAWHSFSKNKALPERRLLAY